MIFKNKSFSFKSLTDEEKILISGIFVLLTGTQAKHLYIDNFMHGFTLNPENDENLSIILCFAYNSDISIYNVNIKTENDKRYGIYLKNDELLGYVGLN